MNKAKIITRKWSNKNKNQRNDVMYICIYNKRCDIWYMIYSYYSKIEV